MNPRYSNGTCWRFWRSDRPFDNANRLFEKLGYVKFVEGVGQTVYFIQTGLSIYQTIKVIDSEAPLKQKRFTRAKEVQKC